MSQKLDYVICARVRERIAECLLISTVLTIKLSEVRWLGYLMNRVAK